MVSAVARWPHVAVLARPLRRVPDQEFPMPIYMNYNNIQGDVTADGYQGWIELDSFQWGVGRDIASPTGSSADRESSAPAISEIVISKVLDTATNKLLSEAYQGDGVTA